MKIVTRYVNPPIPDRGWDWVAFIEDMEGEPQGSGPTERAALADLLEQLYLLGHTSTWVDAANALVDSSPIFRGIEGDAS